MLGLDQILNNFNENEVSRVFYKHLAINDNSKNQPYLGSGWDIVSILPLGQISEYVSSRRSNFKCSINFYWLNNSGQLCHAPNSKLILYEKYPEVRLSGFIRGCTDRARIGRLMNAPREETLQRTLILGITRDKRILAYVREFSESLEKQLKEITLESFGALTEIQITSGIASIDQLKCKVMEIRDRGWCRARYLADNNGILEPILLGNHNNAHGMTLEAELGIPHNSRSSPDWRGWEFKAKKINDSRQASYAKPVTLMTPAPDGGLYSSNFENFIYAYGKQRNSSPLRFDFNGTHYYDLICSATQLKLQIVGFENGDIQPGGAILLLDPGDNVVSSWSFSTLLKIWNNKHQRFVIIPAMVRLTRGYTECKYLGQISYGINTDFRLFLNALINSIIKYDPGCRIDPNSRVIKRERHQFRISSLNLSNLYKKFWHNVDLE